MITKQELRKKAKEIRNSLDMKKLSEQIANNIKNFDIYKKANNVMVFYPFGNEIDLRGLLNDEKNFYLPKVKGKNLLVCPYKSGDELRTSDFNTQEPLSTSIDSAILDLVFVPALMADKKLNRIGYGGGFYDRFLSKLSSNIVKVVAIPSILVVDEIPADDFDEFVDFVITEKSMKKTLP